MIIEMIVWLLILELLSFISLPLSFILFSSLKDRGYGISKIIGVFLPSFITWYISFFINYNLSIIISLLIFVGINFYIAKKVNIKFNKRLSITTEILFISSFIIFCLIRSFTPAVEGLEKLFDISLINGILKSEKMPPHDPWFAGHKINYYYFGHFTVATITKLSHIPSTTTFNLFLATIYSLLTVGVFAICHTLTGNIKFGLIGVFLFIFLSNLLGILQIITFLNPKLVEFFSEKFDIKYAMTCCHDPKQNFMNFLLTFPVWSSTRVIPNTINEFPYANLMFGEVHSHIISLPLQILALSLILVVFLTKNYSKVWIVSFAIVLAMIYMTNSWDLPIYFILFLATTINFLLERKIKIKKLFLINLFLFITFFLSVAPYVASVKKNINFGFAKEKSNVFQEIILFPVFIFSIYYYYLKGVKNFEKLFFLFLLSFIISLLVKIQILILILPIVFLCLNKIFFVKGEEKFVNLLVLFGCIVMIIPEIIFIDSRYNTVFKFYYHIWIFWSLSTVIIIEKLKNERMFLMLLIFLIILSLPMTIFSTIDRFNQGLRDGFSLDGLRYMKVYHPEDYALLEWGMKNIKNNEIILEASGDAFTYSSIFSSYTGVQTLVGWNNHVGIHHNIWPEERIKEIEIIYETNDENLAKNLIKKYNISYIFFGSVEKKKFDNPNITKFGKPVYSYGDSFIFKVN